MRHISLNQWDPFLWVAGLIVVSSCQSGYNFFDFDRVRFGWVWVLVPQTFPALFVAILLILHYISILLQCCVVHSSPKLCNNYVWFFPILRLKINKFIQFQARSSPYLLRDTFGITSMPYHKGSGSRLDQPIAQLEIGVVKDNFFTWNYYKDNGQLENVKTFLKKRMFLFVWLT